VVNRDHYHHNYVQQNTNMNSGGCSKCCDGFSIPSNQPNIPPEPKDEQDPDAAVDGNSEEAANNGSASSGLNYNGNNFNNGGGNYFNNGNGNNSNGNNNGNGNNSNGNNSNGNNSNGNNSNGNNSNSNGNEGGDSESDENDSNDEGDSNNGNGNNAENIVPAALKVTGAAPKTKESDRKRIKKIQISNRYQRDRKKFDKEPKFLAFKNLVDGLIAIIESPRFDRS
jgi:hypothetical protein